MSTIRLGMVALGVLVLAAACGSQPAAATVDAAFQERALAACAKTLGSKQAMAPFPAGSFDPTKPDPAKLATVGAWLETEVAPTFAAWSDDVKALGDPASGLAAWQSFRSLVDAIPPLVGEQIAATKAGDPASFAAATKALQASNAKLRPAAAAAGVAACGDIVA